MSAITEGFKHLFKNNLSQIRYAFAYGSAVQHQSGYDAEKMSRAMVDMMLVVPDTAAFHQTNLESNPDHYSWLMRVCGEDFRQKVQNAGAGVFFNTDVRFGGRKAKYGIISASDFCNDLLSWETFYVAGRLQKPVLDLVSADERTTKILETNKLFALNLALLNLPETFSTIELFRGIVSLSYVGDVRMGIAEHPDKVQNIVEGQYEALLKYYQRTIQLALRTDSNTNYRENATLLQIKPGVILRQISPSRWQQDVDPMVRILRFCCTGLNSQERRARMKDGRYLKLLRSITWWPSVVQSAKGLLTADPGIALRYLGEKLKKRLIL